MPFLVQATIDDHTLAVTTETAKEAYAKAIEWHVVNRLNDISISDIARSYSIADFALVMSRLEITNTLEAAGPLGPEAKGK